MTMEFKRGPASTGYLYGSGSEPALFYNCERKDIRIFSTIPSKGGGDTRCMLRIGTDSFDTIVRTMLRADPESFDEIARAMVRVDVLKAVEAFGRAKQERLDEAKRFLERSRARSAEAAAGPGP